MARNRKLDLTSGPADKGQILFKELSGNGSNKVILQGPDNLASDLTLTLPSSLVNNGLLRTDGDGNLSLSLILNASIDAAAAISLSKLAALTASRALVSDGSGVISVSDVTSTELSYLDGVTSNIQTQLDDLESDLTTEIATKADTDLSNLTATAINESLVPATDSDIDLGDSTHRFAHAHLGKIEITDDEAGTYWGVPSAIIFKEEDGHITTEDTSTVDANTPPLYMTTGANVAASGSGDTGQMDIVTGDVQGGSDGNSGPLTLGTGVVGAGGSGQVQLQSGDSNDQGDTGNVLIKSGTTSGAGTRGFVRLEGAGIQINEQTAPGTPETGYVSVYAKTDGKLYKKNDAGTEVQLDPSVANSAVTSKTANYTATTSDDVILCNTSGGAFTITLPAAASSTGKRFIIKLTTAGNILTVDGDGAETIDGSLTKQMGTAGDFIDIVSDGSNWQVVSKDIKIYARYWASGSTASGNPINFASKKQDTLNCVTTGAGWKFTAPETGFYFLETLIFNTVGAYIGLYKGGALQYFIGYVISADGVGVAASSIYLTAGEYIHLQVNSGTTSGNASEGASSASSINIWKL